MSEPTVQVYLRNSQKMGKLLSLPPQLSSDRLYEAAAESQKLEPTRLHLYINGKLIQPGQEELTLKEKAIIHVVQLEEAAKEVLEVKVRMLEGRTHPNKMDVSSQETLREFIDQHLYKLYGEKSDKLVLIHLGRQLPLDRTFKEEDIEDGAQLICVNLQELRAKNRKVKKTKHEEDEENELYPTPNFPIEVPQEVNATSNMDLLFDPTIHQSSSIPEYSLAPEDVIPEEETNLVTSSSDREHPETEPTAEGQNLQQADKPYQPELVEDAVVQQQIQPEGPAQTSEPAVPSQKTKVEGDDIISSSVAQEEVSPEETLIKPCVEKIKQDYEEKKETNKEQDIQAASEVKESSKEEDRVEGEKGEESGAPDLTES